MKNTGRTTELFGASMCTNHVLQRRLIAVATILVTVAAVSFSQTAEQIMRNVEQNRIHGGSIITGRFIVEDRFGTKTNEFTVHAEGEDLTLMEFTSGPEKGQKILRDGDRIYLYYPDAEEVIRMEGSALRESIAGSDFSYEDMTGGKSILDDYEVTLEGTETVQGVSTYRISMEAKRRDIAYPKQTVWIDQELYVARKGEYFAQSGRMLKDMVVPEVMTVSGIHISERTVMHDKLKRNSTTTFIVEEAEIGVDLPADTFSLEQLTW